VPLLHELWRSGAAAAEAAGMDAAAGADAGAAAGAGAAGATGVAAGAAAVRRVAMSRSEQRAVDVMQPAHRNMNGFMFGGYLMRRALEVAWLSAYRFARQPPTFVGLDDVVFRKPVEVGRLVEYIGRVVYAGEDGSLRVIVKAHRLSLRTGRTDPTNQFHFIFRPSS
jgi:acyl-CoA hydrolase